jgi:hypothetical protein
VPKVRPGPKSTHHCFRKYGILSLNSPERRTFSSFTGISTLLYLHLTLSLRSLHSPSTPLFLGLLSCHCLPKTRSLLLWADEVILGRCGSISSPRSIDVYRETEGDMQDGPSYGDTFSTSVLRGPSCHISSFSRTFSRLHKVRNTGVRIYVGYLLSINCDLPLGNHQQERRHDNYHKAKGSRGVLIRNFISEKYLLGCLTVITPL